MVENPFKVNKPEIKYHVINSALAGVLVFLGSLVNGFSWAGAGAGLIAGLVVCATKFKEYWATQEGEYKRTLGLFSFI